MIESSKRDPWRAWTIVGLSFVALALVFSARAALGLVMPVLESELGWSLSFTSGAAGAALIVMAILAPLAGRLTDRHGARAVILIGLLALALGCFLIAATSHPWAFFVAFGGIGAVGFGLVATHVVSTVVEREFTENRGLATGIATSGSTGGQFLIIPLLALLLTEFDWRWAFAAVGAGAIVIAIAVVRWFPRGVPDLRKSAAVETGESSLTADLDRIIRLPAFQILFWSYFICGYTTSGVIETHFIPYAATCGFSPVQSATAYGLLSAVNIFGMIAAGWLTDRMHRPLLLGLIYIIRGVSFAILVQIGASLELLVFFAVLFGLVDYSTVPVTASLVASHIGVRVMGLALGLITAGHQIGAAIGAFLSGILYDSNQSYDWVWWSSLALSIAAGFLVFLLRESPGHMRPLQFQAG